MYANGARREFTETEDQHLVEYIATENPGATKRTGNKLYENLVENADGKWPWSKTHSWMSWRERYKKNQEKFDRRIRRYQKENGIEVPEDDKVKKTQPSRNQFTEKEDKLLVAYIAKMNPDIKGRLGNKLYDTLVEDEEGKWPWSQTHSSLAWRQRYKANQESFDEKIRIYQEKRGIQSTIRENDNKRKRKPDDNDDERERKRAKGKMDEDCHKEPPRRSARDKGKEGAKESSTTRTNRQTEKPKTTARPGTKDKVSGPSSKPVSSRVRGDQGIPKRINSAPLPKIPEDRMVRGKGKGKAEVVEVAQEVSDTDDDDNDEVPRGPVGSDDYRGDIYAEGEPDDDSELAAEVNAMLTDNADMSDEEIEQSPIPGCEPDELQPLDTPTVLDHAPEIIRTPRADEDRGVLDLSQEPTPPLSTTDDIPHEIEMGEEQTNPSSKSTKLMDGGGSDSPPKAQAKEGSGASLVDTRTSIPREGVSKHTSAAKPPLRPLALLKRKQSEAEDPFGPSPPTPNSEQESRRPVRKRQVPVLEEDAFTNRFRGTRRSLYNTETETNSDDSEQTGKPIAVWPPKSRGKVKSVALPWGSADIIKDNERPIQTNRAEPCTTSEPLADRNAVEGRHPAKQASRVQSNALASTSRNMLPPRESSAPTLFRAATSESVYNTSAEQRAESGWQEELITPNDSTLIEPEVDSAAKRVAVVLARKSIGTDSSISGNGFRQDIEQKVSLPISLPTSELFQPPRPQSPLSDDPFIDSPFKKGNRRGNEGIQQLVGPRIDLRCEVEKQQRHSRLSSVSSASRNQRRAPRKSHSTRAYSVLSIPLPEEELSAIHELGLKEMISRIARKHGFLEEVVWNVFKKSESIKNTENVIIIMKRHAEEAATKALEQLKGIPADDDESEQERDESEQEHDESEQEQEKDDMEENATPERPERTREMHSRNRPSNRDSLGGHAGGKTGHLLIKPLADDDHMSDYSPPISSRAGKYVRLTERGREDEAVERERKRASLGYSVSRLLPRARTPEESPTKRGRHSVPMLQMKQASRLPSPKEPEPAKFMELTDEVKEKFKNASRENIEELHELEKTVDQKALMDWFVSYMRELRVKPEPDD